MRRKSWLVSVLGIVAVVVPVIVLAEMGGLWSQILWAQEAASAVAQQDAADDLGVWWKFLGRFHFIMLHLPIGFLAIVFLLDVYSWFRSSPELRKATTYCLVWATLGGAVAAGMGWMLSDEGGYDPDTLFYHKWLGTLVVVLSLITTVAQKHSYAPMATWFSRAFYRLSLVVALLAISIAGHFGGDLTHGSGFLVESCPKVLEPYLAVVFPQEFNKNDNPLEATDEGEAYFLEHIWPLFEDKCFRCHGPKKQKGDYRLDDKDIAFQGGESGQAAIVPGEPAQSPILASVLLSVDHDEVMPPNGKDPLTQDEIYHLIEWIRMGAPYVARPGASAGDEDADENEDAGESATSDEDSAEPPVGGGEGKLDAKPDGETSPPPEPGSPAARFAAVRGIIEGICLNCHNAKRRKGKLVLESWEKVLTGGEDEGPAVKPGDPEASPLYQRVIIDPAEDEDELMMPPEDKGGPLTSEQKEAMRLWIESGAHWPAGVVLQRKKA